MKSSFFAYHQQYERRVDEAMYDFLEGILDPTEFFMLKQYSFQLEVRKKQVKAIADIIGVHLKSKVFGIFVCKDRVKSGGDENEGEAQAISNSGMPAK